MSRNRRFALYLLLVCAACAPQFDGAWGGDSIIATVPQSEPAAMALIAGIPVFSWVGVDERGVHHDARLDEGEPQTLPLPPRLPRRQTLVAGAGDRAHLLWLDADEDGVTRLYNGLLTMPTLEVERGPTPMSDVPVLDYAAAEDASGGVFVAFSSGASGEPSLILTAVDTQGRPLPVLDRVRGGEKPSFLWIGSTLHIFWINRPQAAILGGIVRSGRISEISSLVPVPYLEAGDRLIDVRAGADETTLYLFWNAAYSDGTFGTRYAYTALGLSSWSPWSPVETPDSAPANEVPFNVGGLAPTRQDDAPLALAAPLARSAASLPVAGLRGDELTVVYFRGGHAVGQQILRRGVSLLQPPLLLTDSSQYLWVSWSEAGVDGSAHLRVLSSANRR